MKNKDSILYLPKNIDLIPNAVLTQGLVWLKPNILKPINHISQPLAKIDTNQHNPSHPTSHFPITQNHPQLSPRQPKPTQATPSKPKPSQPKAAQGSPNQPKQTQANPAQANLSQPNPSQASPSKPKSAQAGPNQTRPTHA